MKTISVLFSILIALTSCKGALIPSGNADEESIITGEFLFWNNAAVLKTDTEIYGVALDEKMYELDNKCKPLKKDEFDMIPVTIRGTIRKNLQSDGWKEIIQIKEIVSVSEK